MARTKKRRAETWWAIEAFGILLPFTARATRRMAIFDFTHKADDSFSEWPKYGVRAVKVRVTEAS